MEDEKILELFWQRDQQALLETQQKYGAYLTKVALNVLGDPEDSRESVNDAYLAAWDAIPPHRPAVLKLFLAKITRNISFTRWRKLTADKRGGGEMELVMEELSSCLADPGSVEDHLNGKELAKVIRAFLDTLPGREQDIFLRRYFFVEESETIARRYGIRQASVLRILSRTRAKLKTYLQKEGYPL